MFDLPSSISIIVLISGISITLKKAIEIVDWILNNKTKTIDEFYKPGIIDSKSDICQVIKL